MLQRVVVGLEFGGLAKILWRHTILQAALTRRKSGFSSKLGAGDRVGNAGTARI
jgi:hypothetical protein